MADENKAEPKKEEKPEEKKEEPKKEEKPETKPEEKKEEKDEKKEVEVPAEFKDIVEKIEKLSVLELSKLVKVLEDKFGVTAQAPMMAAAPAAGGAGDGEGGEAEKSEFNLELTDAGSNKIAVIKVVRELTEKGLKEAKDLVDGAPKVIKEAVPKKEAEEAKKKIEEAGGKLELK